MTNSMLDRCITDDQREATTAFLAWWESDDPRQFALAGHAGTGKTHLASLWMEYVESAGERPKAATFTNRAASVLRKKGVKASTLHRLLYRPTDKDASKVRGDRRRLHSRYDKLVESGRGLSTEAKRLLVEIRDLDDKIAELTSPDFKPKDGDSKPSVVFVDEASMVPATMIDNLRDLKVPLVFVGDPGQLPPVKDIAVYHEMPKDATLTDVVRYDDGGLLAFAEHARRRHEWGAINGSVTKIDDKEQIVSMLVESSGRSSPLAPAGSTIAVCHGNLTRCNINSAVRKRMGRTSYLPEPGEIVVALDTALSEDSRLDRLHNGSRYVVVTIKPLSSDGVVGGKAEDVFLATLSDDRGQFQCLVNGRWFEWLATGMVDAEGRAFASSNATMSKRLLDTNSARYYQGARKTGGSWLVPVPRLDFGYALTAHKAQGGEWSTVIVVDDHPTAMSRNTEYGRFLYTAATRASERLVMHMTVPFRKPSNMGVLQELRKKWDASRGDVDWAYPVVRTHLAKAMPKQKAAVIDHMAKRTFEELSGSRPNEQEIAQDDLVVNNLSNAVVRQACVCNYEEYRTGKRTAVPRILFEGACKMRASADTNGELGDLVRLLRSSGDNGCAAAISVEGLSRRMDDR